MQSLTKERSDRLPVTAGPWERVPGLIDRAASLEALRAHRLQLLAASLWRSRGDQLPSGLREEERRATMTALAAIAVLRRARAAYGGRLMLMKGPEVAASYPEPRTRPYNDIDLLADDPVGAQRALLAAGFVPRADARDHSRAQHLDPLIDPELAMLVEIHRRPNCPARVVAPTTDELFLGVRGDKPPEAHAWVTVGGVIVQGAPIDGVTELASFA